jgi:cation:H+ antiporter
VDILLAISAVVGGLVLLGWGADRLILGACGLARRARLSEAVIGATIVAGGTSMPELVASVSGALAGQYGMAVGNVVGSNIFNVAAILGAVALVAPMLVARDIARRDWWVMAGVTAVFCAAVVAVGAITWWLAALSLLLFAAYVGWSLRTGGHDGEDGDPTPIPPVASGLGWIALGVLLLAGGGQALVWGAAGLATMAGVSDAVIGLTVVAAGTSAPELVTSLVAARRGQHHLAVANIIGSNTFNLLFILGVTGLFGTLPVAAEILHRDLWVMLAVALVLPLAWGFGALRIGRVAGGFLLAGYLVYLGFLLRTVGD